MDSFYTPQDLTQYWVICHKSCSTSWCT